MSPKERLAEEFCLTEPSNAPKAAPKAAWKVRPKAEPRVFATCW